MEAEAETDTKLTEVLDDREFNYLDKQLEAVLEVNGFKGSVYDYSVIDSEFRRRTNSSLGALNSVSSVIGSQSSSNNDKWLGEREGDDEMIEMPNRLSMGIMTGDGKDSYVEFFCNLHAVEVSILLFRRFSDFEKFEANLRKALKADGVTTSIPALPAKQIFSFSGRWKDKKFVEQRRMLLDAWLKAVLVVQSDGGVNVRYAFKSFIYQL